MIPFSNNPYAVFGFPGLGVPPGFFPFPVRRTNIPVIDRRGIYEVCTTGIVENLETNPSVDYGINPCVWRALPNQSIILWKVRHPVSQNGAALPVNVVVPARSSSSTVTSSGANAGTSKIPVVDNKGTQAQGGDVTVPTGSGQTMNTTEHIVYIDKSAGIFRLLGVQSANSPTANTPTENTPANAAAKTK